MHTIYEINNLPFWDEADIQERDRLQASFAEKIRAALQERNRAWKVSRIEAPMLIPRDLLSEAYSDDQIFAIPSKITSLRLPFAMAMREAPQEARAMAKEMSLSWEWERALESAIESEAERWDARLDEMLRCWAKKNHREPKELALRPETTPATYAWMEKKIKERPTELPWCCWQLNKSFRREQDQPSKHVRLKEFWQQEFQCAYASDSKEDWMSALIDPVRDAVAQLTRCPARIVVADRLPAYSCLTLDVEVWNSQKWMEICSVSKRLDFPESIRLPIKPNQPPREILVLEVATSPDRQLHCSRMWRQAWESLRVSEHRDDDWRASLVSNERAAEQKQERRSRAVQRH